MIQHKTLPNNFSSVQINHRGIFLLYMRDELICVFMPSDSTFYIESSIMRNPAFGRQVQIISQQLREAHHERIIPKEEFNRVVERIENEIATFVSHRGLI